MLLSVKLVVTVGGLARTFKISQAAASTPLAAACSALLSVRDIRDNGVPRRLLDGLHAWLLAQRDGAGAPAAAVHFAEAGLRVDNARSASSADGELLQGSATFVVEEKRMATRLPVVRATTRVQGVEISVLAVVSALAKPQHCLTSEHEVYNCEHFIGRYEDAQTGHAETEESKTEDTKTEDAKTEDAGYNKNKPLQLVSINTLKCGKCPSEAIGVLHGCSHYLRRQAHLQAHTQAMRNLGIAVNNASMQRIKTPLIDAYVSHTRHQRTQLVCACVCL